MPKDPICGMEVNSEAAVKIKKDGEVFYFCSSNCAQKFAHQHKMGEKELAACLIKTAGKWYKNKAFLVGIILVVLYVVSYIIDILQPFRMALTMYLRRIWWAVLAGLFLGGIIDYYIPKEYISRILGKRDKKTIFYAVTLGFFMSACSHGILALSIELHKKGASTSSVIAFLLASPWANFPLTIMLLGFFGLKALYIIFCALLVAVTTGFIYQALERKGWVEVNKNSSPPAEEFSIRNDFKSRFKSYRFTIRQITRDIKGILDGSAALSDMVLWWILIGVGLASLVAAYVPQDIFRTFMGPTIGGLAVTLLAATIIEVCSEGSSPLAFEIYRQTTAFGNAFVFLMAGVVTDYTEIGLLWHNVGKKTAMWLPVITVPQVVILGMLANWIW